jgi:hypothetical protein
MVGRLGEEPRHLQCGEGGGRDPDVIAGLAGFFNGDGKTNGTMPDAPRVGDAYADPSDRRCGRRGVESSREEHENSRWGGGHDRRPLPAPGLRSRGSRRAARCVEVRVQGEDVTAAHVDDDLLCAPLNTRKPPRISLNSKD